MSRRPSLFEGMGADFVEAFGNVDAVLTIAGVAKPKVRGVLRIWREVELVEEMSQAVEGTTHVFSIAATDAPGLESRRDTVTIDGVTYPIINLEDDARAMFKLFLSGDI